MTGGPEPGRLTGRQAALWAVAFLIIVVLVTLYFVYGRQVRPMLGALPASGTWLRSS